MSVTADAKDAMRTGGVGIRDYGDRALLIECDSTAEVLAWTETLRAAELPGVDDLVPAARTVLIKLAGVEYQAPTRQRLGTVRPTDESVHAAAPPKGRADVVIDVVYDGADLDEVARLTGLDVDQVVAAHTGTPWLVGGDERLAVPRRTDPRTKVPVGSVGLAGEFSGIYPRESPGGWQLIGRTSATLWDIDRDDPALLMPGMWVQFRAVQS